jgi:hypothetical protein
MLLIIPNNLSHVIPITATEETKITPEPKPIRRLTFFERVFYVS